MCHLLLIMSCVQFCFAYLYSVFAFSDTLMFSYSLFTVCSNKELGHLCIQKVFFLSKLTLAKTSCTQSFTCTNNKAALAVIFPSK